MTLAKSASYINVNIYSLSPVFLSLEAVILLFSGDNLEPALGSTGIENENAETTVNRGHMAHAFNEFGPMVCEKSPRNSQTLA